MLFIVTLCFCLTGCGNEFAKKEYDSDEKIAKAEERYAKDSSVFNPIDGGKKYAYRTYCNVCK